MRRMVNFTTVFVLTVASSVHAQDVRDREIMVVDQRCIEEKLVACVLEKIPSTPIGPKGRCGPVRTKVREDNRWYCKTTNIAVVAEQDTIRYLQDCKPIVENFPSYPGTKSCLKPLAQERLLNAISSDLKYLIQERCRASGDPKCQELDKVPE